MTDFARRYIDAYTSDLTRIISELCPQMAEHFPKMAKVFDAARQAGRTIFTMGNGGSAAEASHLANDVNKYTIRSGHKRYKCVSLCDNTPVIMAWANDASYEDVFVEQLRNHLEPGDVLVGISGSGNSANCVKALAYAREVGAATMTFTGYGGGKMVPYSDFPIVIPSDSMIRCEDAHVIIHHCFIGYLTEAQDAGTL